jgi:hypothetical protein
MLRPHCAAHPSGASPSPSTPRFAPRRRAHLTGPAMPWFRAGPALQQRQTAAGGGAGAPLNGIRRLRSVGVSCSDWPIGALQSAPSPAFKRKKGSVLSFHPRPALNTPPPPTRRAAAGARSAPSAATKPRGFAPSRAPPVQRAGREAKRARRGGEQGPAGEGGTAGRGKKQNRAQRE